VFGIGKYTKAEKAALIAWTAFVRVDDFVKGGAISTFTRIFDAMAPPPSAVADP